MFCCGGTRMDTLNTTATLVQNAQVFLDEQKSQEPFVLPNEQILTDLSERLIKLLEIKPNLKGQCTSERAKMMFYQYLIQDPCSWPTEQETDIHWNKTVNKIKEEKDKIEDEKTKIESLLEIAEEGQILLQKNIEDLENKIEVTNQKICRAKTAKKQWDDKMAALGKDFPCNESLEQMKLKKKSQLNKLDAEILAAESHIEMLSLQIENHRDLLKAMSSRIQHERAEKQKLQTQNETKNLLAKEKHCNLKKLLEEMQRLAGIEECPANYNEIKIKFLNPSQTETQLYLTMTLHQDSTGHTRLKTAEVNIPTLHCSDLIDNAVTTNDVKSLITELRHRWNTYYPIMIEIDQISERHAVDWIQDEGLVRILVGKGGTVMFSLKMPPGYPFSGDITVETASGLPPDTSVEDFAPIDGAKRLQQWVDYLEEKFGKP